LVCVTERKANDCTTRLWKRHFVICGHFVVGHCISTYTESLFAHEFCLYHWHKLQGPQVYIIKRTHFCSTNQLLCAFVESSQNFCLCACSNTLDYEVGYGCEM